MRVKLIGVSDEARKSESIALIVQGAFDGFFAEKKLENPSFSSPKQEIMNDENAPATAEAEPANPPSKPRWRLLQWEDWIVDGRLLAISGLVFVFGAEAD